MRKKRCLISKENETTSTDQAASGGSHNKRARGDSSDGLVGDDNLFEENEFVTDADENNRRWYKDPNDIFVNYVNKAGLKISVDKDIPCTFEHELDHPTFVRTLSDLLRKNEQDQKEFADAFERFCENVDRFIIVLMPTESDICGVQDSLVRALLLLDPIQTQLALFLINKMSEFAQMRPVSAQRNIPKLILAQFRYLEFVVDCRKLSRKIFELMDSFGAFKDDIIRCLPELIDDETEQQRAADGLNTIMERADTSTNTKIAILECFNHLYIMQENKQKILDTMFKQLPKITVNLLPSMVNFCLMSVIDDKDAAFETIGRLRSQLPLMDIDRFSSFSNSEEHPLVLILQSIQMKVRFRDATFGKAVLRSVTDLEETKPFDIFLLLVLRELQKYSKRVITEIRKLVREGNISDDSLNVAFKHTAVMKKYFKGVLEIAEVLIRSAEEVSREFGAYLYKLCFTNFGNIHKQHVIVALASHVGSESNETDCALACLKEMIDDRLAEIQPFEIFIRNLLNYLYLLNYEQVKTLFEILSSLAQSSVDEGDSALDDIKIVIGKNIGSSTAREKTWGVIGSLMLLKALLQMKNRSSEQKNEILSLVKSLEKSTRNSAKTRSLFYEELGSVVSDTSDGMEALSWLYDQLCQTFRQRYLISSDDLLPNDNRVVFDLRPRDMITEKSVINLADNNELLCLSPLFRLVAMFAKKQYGQAWDEVKKWFVLPVTCYDSNTVTANMRESDEKAKDTCTVLFYCANWFRQLLNTLYSDEGSKVDVLLLSRLRDLLKVESDLFRCLEKVSSFSVPLGGLHADEENKYIIQQEVTVGGRKTKPKKAKKQKPESSIYLNDHDEDDDQPGPSTGRAPTKAPEGAKIFEPDKYRTFLQPLKSDLLYRLLKLPVDFAPEAGSVDSAHKLTAKDLFFLLSQLGLRLEEVLPAKQLRFAGFGKAAKCQLFETKERPLDLVNGFDEIVPNLKKLMDYCSRHFKETIEQHDGILDSRDMSNHQSLELAECLYECLSALAATFGWVEFANRVDVQITICGAFIEQSGGKSAKTLVDCVFNYLVQMSNSVPDFKCAMAVINNLKALCPVTSKSQLSTEKIAEVAHEYLKREWANPANPSEHRGSAFNAKLKQLLNAYMGRSNSEVLIKPIVTIGFADLLNNKQTRESGTYKTLTKYSFACYYRIVMQSLVRLAKQIPKKNDLKEKDDAEKAKKNRENCFNSWNEAITLFNMSIQMIRDSNEFRSVTVMNATLREGRLFIECISDRTSSFFFLVDSHLEQFGDKLMKLIKVFQKSTRLLCHLCDHIKANNKLKQKTILRLLPEVRITLEKLVRMMQQSLACAGVDSAMEIGSTSKKDLETGKDISETDENSEIPDESPEIDGDVLEDLGDDDDVVPDSGDESGDESDTGLSDAF